MSQSQSTAEESIEQELTAHINASELINALTTVTQIANEAKIHFTEADGMEISAVGEANVGMVEVSVGNEGFEQLNTNGVIIPTNVNELLAQAKSIKSEPVDAEERTLTLELTEEHRLRLSSENGSMTVFIGIIDPETIRDEPDIPDSMSFDSCVEMNSRLYNHIMKTADGFGETLHLLSEPDVVHTKAEGDINSLETTLRPDHAEIVEMDTSTCNTMVGVGYMNKVRKGLPRNVVMRLEFQNNHPVRVTADFSHTDVSYYIAPRVNTDN